MATTLSSTDIKTLEATRQRLSQLATTLASLQSKLVEADPLPPYSTISGQTQILSQVLASLSEHISANSDLLQATSTYPLPSYPGKEQEGLLSWLLRKKLEPGVEDWVEDGRAVGTELGNLAETKRFWQWAGMAANEEARKYEWGGDLSEEEGSEKEDENDDDDKDDDEMMQDNEPGDTDNGSMIARAEEQPEQPNAGGPPMPLENVLSFMMKGIMT